MNDELSFTLAIPAYKRAFLGEALDSCFAQTYPDFEVVVVDDDSPEHLESVVAGYKDSRLHYYKNSSNIGAINLVTTWNKCLEYAKGDYIICMGDDDKLKPCCLEEYVKLIQKYPKLKVFHAQTEIINEHSEVIEQTPPRPQFESALSLLYHRWNGRKRQFIGDFCFKTEDLRREGGFYKLPMAWGSDDISALRAATPDGIANTQNPCFQYRINPLTISQTGSGKVKMQAIEEEQKWLKDYLASLDASTLTEADLHLLEQIKNQQESHYEKKRDGVLRKDLKHSPSHLFYWLRNSKTHSLTISGILLAFLAAILKRKKS